MRAAPARLPPPPAQRKPIGIGEYNPNLVDPGRVPAAFARARDRLAALRPAYYRLPIYWFKFQPSPGIPADLRAAEDGCSRGTPPCAAWAGVEQTLRAVAAAQRAHGGYEVVVFVSGVPDWAAQGPSGCERAGVEPRSRPITDAGLRGYAALLRGVAALGRRTGVALRYWSPWNEPNHPASISPQRAQCDPGSPSLAPGVYTRLARTARSALGPRAKLVLGELAGFPGPSPRTTGVEEFVRALPDDVACDGAVWAQHDYAQPDGRSPDAVAELERALATRPCTAGKPIWVTETGVGGVHSGADRDTSAPALAEQCGAQAELLERWDRDPRVRAVFQFSFREDAAYPVGLVGAGLTRLYPTYALWRAWANASPSDPGPPARPPGC